jgi:hypothetical protein
VDPRTRGAKAVVDIYRYDAGHRLQVASNRAVAIGDTIEA